MDFFYSKQRRVSMTFNMFHHQFSLKSSLFFSKILAYQALFTGTEPEIFPVDVTWTKAVELHFGLCFDMLFTCQNSYVYFVEPHRSCDVFVGKHMGRCPESLSAEYMHKDSSEIVENTNNFQYQYYYVPSSKLTLQWNIPIFNREYGIHLQQVHLPLPC